MDEGEAAILSMAMFYLSLQALQDALFEHEAMLQSRERYRAMSMATVSCKTGRASLRSVL